MLLSSPWSHMTISRCREGNTARAVKFPPEFQFPCVGAQCWLLGLVGWRLLRLMGGNLSASICTELRHSDSLAQIGLDSLHTNYDCGRICLPLTPGKNLTLFKSGMPLVLLEQSFDSCDNTVFVGIVLLTRKVLKSSSKYTRYNTVQYSTVQYSTVQYSTVHTIQYKSPIRVVEECSFYSALVKVILADY